MALNIFAAASDRVFYLKGDEIDDGGRVVLVQLSSTTGIITVCPILAAAVVIKAGLDSRFDPDIIADLEIGRVAVINQIF